MTSIRTCCFPDEDGSHSTFCLDGAGIDKTKLRNKLRDTLNKLDTDTSVKTLLEIAKQLNFLQDDIPYIPLTPIDYHDENKRPHFGPLQVRHASDLIKGKHYIRVIAAMVNYPLTKQRCKFEGFNFSEENENLGLIEHWKLSLTMVDEERDCDYKWNPMPLYDVSLCPIPKGLDTKQGWVNNMWLEFLPENVADTCLLSLQKVYDKFLEIEEIE